MAPCQLFALTHNYLCTLFNELINFHKQYTLNTAIHIPGDCNKKSNAQSPDPSVRRVLVM